MGERSQPHAFRLCGSSAWGAATWDSTSRDGPLGGAQGVA
jgi:hypothetical protein